MNNTDMKNNGIEYAKKLWNKIILNSFYPAIGSDKFYLYDEETAKKIEENGKNKLRQIRFNK